MKIIYTESFCDNDLGEADAFFDVVNGKLTLLTAWSNNDAMYRSEYMDPLFEALGFKINNLPKKYKKDAKKLTKDFFGI